MPDELTATIQAATTSAEIQLLARGLMAYAGQELQKVADGLEAHGQREHAARARAQGRQAAAHWPED